MSRTFLIALAEDDPDDQYLFNDVLKLERINARCAIFNNGAELLHYLISSSQIPDVIILDLNMPMLNGIKTLQRLKEKNETKFIPVFILTTSNSDSDRKTCLQLGANNYYCKPSSIRELGAIVSGIIDSLSI